MKKLIMMAAMIAVFGLGGAAAFAAASDKPASPPGQDECEHGNSQKPCRDDPQPEKGKDCEEHGPFEGGVNEDHCLGETPTVPDTPTVPETPTVPDTPTVPETPTVPDTPTVPETPKVTDTATVPEAPTVPEVPTTTTETTPTETQSSPQTEPHVFTPPTSQKPAQGQPVSQKPAQSQSAPVAEVGAIARPSKAPQLAPFTP